MTELRRRIWLSVLMWGILALIAAPVSRAASKPAPSATSSWSITVRPFRLVNGAPLWIRVRPPRGVRSLQGTWLGHELHFVRDPKSQWWDALAGISLKTGPGTYTLKLEASGDSGAPIPFERPLRVARARYRSITAKVAKKYTEPSPEQQVEIKQAQDVKDQKFGVTTPEREWSGAFAPPVHAPVSDQFGTRRTFNGEVQSVHQGLDYAVPAGSPVLAINRGVVLIARPLYFEGNCVVIDHGQGLLSLYMHLSKVEVTEGETLKRGQEVGLSGASGRATGPHLHLAVRWQGEYLDPATLLALKIR